MKILAIDSSSLVATVAIVDEEKILAEYTINHKKTHSQTLLPMLGEIVKMIELDMKEIDAIAISGGPGSFTGLRIGSATAKGLGLALDKPLIHVPTLDAMAYNFYKTEEVICPIMDARRNQVYTGLYTFTNGEFEVMYEQAPMGIDELIQKLNEMNKKVIFLGDGVPVFKNYIEENASFDITFAPAHLSRQRASSVGALGYEYFKKGKIQTAAEHGPEYLRLSQAERELNEKKMSE
ncbi:MAG: tRNA (adenosine(37)-N6)-threonylcarbamoyltransferase complex dimerization subunit type 1 TsaB [Lachnospiraceae bacterium]|nr:tRNA (adenosine(37)-N6)-threonylcarbamoyltransferase complex dimerization subunit type 1 TsaB [Lachnospiraceae bacterium]MBQ4068604.1 tRNA (adenosine(37)-N6)-threonylcarbamoyltransferase complex dimerization subunit type 1 TsaB [Lachnospiraceae bacterium]